MDKEDKEEIRQLVSAIEGFHRHISELEHEMFEAQQTICGLLSLDLNISSDDIDLGWSWDCEKSPTGMCVYNSSEDPCNDVCLYCGHPEERK